MTIDASRKFAADRRRGEQDSIARAMPTAFASFSSTAMMAEVSITINEAAHTRHSPESRLGSAYRDPARTRNACRFPGFQRQGCVPPGPAGPSAGALPPPYELRL